MLRDYVQAKLIKKISPTDIFIDIYLDYKTFNFKSSPTCYNHLLSMFNNTLKPRIYEPTLNDMLKKYRENQIANQHQFFRQMVTHRYVTCIMTGYAAHKCDIVNIVSSNDTVYNISNGLLLEKSLCGPFNSHVLSINPMNFRIETRQSNKYRTISTYDSIKVNDSIFTTLTKDYLTSHYNKFLSKISMDRQIFDP